MNKFNIKQNKINKIFNNIPCYVYNNSLKETNYFYQNSSIFKEINYFRIKYND
jgi:hypothetical protein